MCEVGFAGAMCVLKGEFFAGNPGDVGREDGVEFVQVQGGDASSEHGDSRAGAGIAEGWEFAQGGDDVHVPVVRGAQESANFFARGGVFWEGFEEAVDFSGEAEGEGGVAGATFSKSSVCVHGVLEVAL